MVLLKDEGRAEDGTEMYSEVEVKENVEYTERDFRAVIEGNRDFGGNSRNRDYGAYGYTTQEFQNGELVDVEGSESSEELLDDYNDSAD